MPSEDPAHSRTHPLTGLPTKTQWQGVIDKTLRSEAKGSDPKVIWLQVGDATGEEESGGSSMASADEWSLSGTMRVAGGHSGGVSQGRLDLRQAFFGLRRRRKHGLNRPATRERH